MSNLAVFTLAQVFFSRDTGVIFMPAVEETEAHTHTHTPGQNETTPKSHFLTQLQFCSF